MAAPKSDSPILDLLATMNIAGIKRASSLDAESLMLVRLAALVAVDAPPISYVLNMEMAGETEISADDVQGMLAAIAPIVGSARVASAAGKMITRSASSSLSLTSTKAKAPSTRSDGRAVHAVGEHRADHMGDRQTLHPSHI